LKNAIFWDATPGGSCKTDVSEELIASIITVKRINALGATLAETSKLFLVTANAVPSPLIFFSP
jgi:hypothetical protein